MQKEMQKETNRPTAKILSQREIDRAPRVVDESEALVDEVKHKSKFEKRLLMALDERFTHIQREIYSLNEAIDELRFAFDDIEDGLEYKGSDEKIIKQELREIKESLKSIKADTKYLRISKTAEKVAPEYREDLLSEENKALRYEIKKLREAIKFGESSKKGGDNEKQRE